MSKTEFEEIINYCKDLIKKHGLEPYDTSNQGSLRYIKPHIIHKLGDKSFYFYENSMGKRVCVIGDNKSGIPPFFNTSIIF